jgi:bleomycin hydrolase
MKYAMILMVLAGLLLTGYPQGANKAIFNKPVNEFYEQMEKSAKAFTLQPPRERLSFKVDFTGLSLPKSKTEFKSEWHNEPVSQGITGTCWSFSTTSFFESEVFRLTKKRIKLSEMFTAYWEYVEKARGFVKSRGESNFGEGSEANAVTRIWLKYGIVPLSVYTGKLPGQTVYDHSKMFDEMNTYLKSVKSLGAWNEEEIAATIKSILNTYMTAPPESFQFENQTYTPKEFFAQVVKINPGDYVDVMSLMEKPYWAYAEYEVPDNWWHSKEYFNVPLDDFMNGIKKAIRAGFTLCIGGDVSEPGIDGQAKVAIVPDFDIPSAYINEFARQLRFTNATTGDDHGIHLVGWMNKNGKDWYLIKDSGASSHIAGDIGYYYYSEDYVKLKMLGFVVHKDAIPEIVSKMRE